MTSRSKATRGRVLSISQDTRRVPYSRSQDIPEYERVPGSIIYKTGLTDAVDPTPATRKGRGVQTSYGHVYITTMDEDGEMVEAYCTHCTEVQLAVVDYGERDDRICRDCLMGLVRRIDDATDVGVGGSTWT